MASLAAMGLFSPRVFIDSAVGAVVTGGGVTGLGAAVVGAARSARFLAATSAGFAPAPYSNAALRSASACAAFLAITCGFVSGINSPPLTGLPTLFGGVTGAGVGARDFNAGGAIGAVGVYADLRFEPMEV
jgi:hypothetical protein